MPDEIQINPRAGVEAPSAPVEPAAPETGAGELPPEIIQNPVMQALMAGQPPAVSADIKAAQQTEFGQLVGKHNALLREAGFNFYRSRDGNLGVLFNQIVIPAEEIVKADQQGSLTKIAPPVEDVERAILADPSANPVLTSKGRNTAAVPAPPSTTPVPGGAPPSGKTQRALATARRKNVGAGTPTSGPRPGAGRILNEILKPVI